MYHTPANLHHVERERVPRVRRRESEMTAGHTAGRAATGTQRKQKDGLSEELGRRLGLLEDGGAGGAWRERCAIACAALAESATAGPPLAPSAPLRSVTCMLRNAPAA